ncbi:MAG: hypothetical protein WD359_10525, partial [Dehalococcoidia bacterium]
MIQFITTIPLWLLQVDDELSGEETAVAVTAIVTSGLVFAIIVGIVAWQLIGAWRTRMAVGREKAYQELSEEMEVAAPHRDHR